jgi:hypothetical protein
MSDTDRAHAAGEMKGVIIIFLGDLIRAGIGEEKRRS